jgi:hypothetical protein
MERDKNLKKLKNFENIMLTKFFKKTKIKYLWCDSHNPKTLFFYIDSTEGNQILDILINVQNKEIQRCMQPKVRVYCSLLSIVR